MKHPMKTNLFQNRAEQRQDQKATEPKMSIKKSKRDEYLERLAKYKQEKEAKHLHPLKENSRNVLSSFQKRKSEGGSNLTANVAKKSKWQSTQIQPLKSSPGKKHELKNSGKPGQSRVGSKVSADQNTKPKTLIERSTSHASSNDNAPKSSTPMSVKLERWKGQKMQKTDKKKDSRKSGQASLVQQNKAAKYLMQPTPKNKYKLGDVSKEKSTEKANTQKYSQCDSIRKPGNQNSSAHVAGHSSSVSKERSVKNFTKTKPSNFGTTKTMSKQTNKYQASLRSPTKSTSTTKSILKRRHSEVACIESPKKKPSILKRKSCIASFSEDTNDEQNYVNNGIQILTVNGQKILNSEQQTLDEENVFVQQACPTKTPENGRNVRFLSPDGENMGHLAVTRYRKTPKEKITQSSMRSKLNDWLNSKGKTPSKFRHLMCFDAHLSAKKSRQASTKRNLTVDELTKQQEAMEREDNIVMNLATEFDQVAEEDGTETRVLTSELDTMLEECSTLFEAGCPVEDTLKWLDSIEDNIPIARSCAKFYICKATVLQSTANLGKVLEVFEMAVRNNAKPSDELATALTAIVKEVSEEREKRAHHHKYLEKEVQKDNIFDSSSIKYCVTQVTPFSKRKRKSEGDIQQTSSSPCAVVTPVRRSTRRSLASLPESLHEKKQLYNSLEEMSDIDKKKSLFQPNDALESVLGSVA